MNTEHFRITLSSSVMTARSVIGVLIFSRRLLPLFPEICRQAKMSRQMTRK